MEKLVVNDVVVASLRIRCCWLEKVVVNDVVAGLRCCWLEKLVVNDVVVAGLRCCLWRSWLLMMLLLQA